MSTRKRKTRYEYEIQGLWGDEWEHETTEEYIWDARERLREYRENQPEVAHRIKLILVPIEA